ncbi:MAG: universal stress protein [Thermoproteales archaeon]|nr:universal stress protein [Thermoproteales archaeon]
MLKLQKKIVEVIPYEEIVREARKNDLIVMGNKGMTALDRIFLGSVAEKVVRHAPCTVMICK